MAEGLELTVVTPERALIQTVADAVQVPGLDGYLGLLPGHAALFSELAIGELSYLSAGKEQFVALARGFVEISDDRVHILADVAEVASEIDVERATEARSRAERWLLKGGDDVDYSRAQDALKRADVRLKVAARA